MSTFTFDEYINACIRGDYDKVVSCVEFFRARISSHEFFNYLEGGLSHVCRAGHYRLVEYLIVTGAEGLDYGLASASQSGNLDIVKLLVKHGAAIDRWGGASFSACKNNYLHIVDFLVSMDLLNFDDGLKGACSGGHYALAKRLIESGRCRYYVKQCLDCACKDGHRAIVDLLIEHGANHWKRGFSAACIGGHRDIAELMIKNDNGGANWDSSMWNLGFSCACENGCKEKDSSRTNDYYDVILFLLGKGITSLDCLYEYYQYDEKFLARVLCRLRGAKRSTFIEMLPGLDWWVVDYLVNKRVLNSAHGRQCKQLRRTPIRGILLQFTCTDVATFTTCFQPCSFT